MSATDELRRLLDERGVEWFESVTRKGLTWIYRDGKAIRFHPWQPGTLKVSMFDLTPAQAIELTLGRGTCVPILNSERDCRPYLSMWFVCSECGCRLTENRLGKVWQKFCPNCGRKVIYE